MILTGLKLSPSHTISDLENSISKSIDFKNFKYKILKKSIDARRNNISYIYSVEVIKSEDNFTENNNLVIPTLSSKTQPVVVGFGPAGIFCSYILAKAGLKPIIFEMGSSIDDRIKNVKEFIETKKLNEMSNIQFGEGGAGTFSDGKLTTGINNTYCDDVLKMFVEHGAPQEILYLKYPHIGTDILVNVIKNIRNNILNMGGEIHFNESVEDITIKNGKIISVTGNKIYPAEYVIFAIGHSSRKTFELLYNKGLNIIQKPFSVGVRIEHLQRDISKNQYGEKCQDLKYLPPANYKLSTHLNGRGIYTFCMCPGGYVIPAMSEKNTIVTNGMSYNKRDGINANSAVLVSITPDDFESTHPLSGMYYQKNIETKAYNLSDSYGAPCQRFEDFLSGIKTKDFGKIYPTYPFEVNKTDINKLFPEYIANGLKEGINSFSQKIKCFNSKDAVLTGPETRSSSPVRIVRDDNFESNIKGIYPIGEGAGYAGGITSSAVDGIKCALSIIKKLL